MHSDPAEQELLEKIRAAYGDLEYEQLPAGGSPARIVRLILADGRSLVAKYQARCETPIDGHELASLKRKVQQLQMVGKCLPQLSPYCAKVLREFQTGNAYGFVMPFYAGQTLSDRMLDNPILARESLVHVMDVLISRGYSQRVWSGGGGHFVRTQLDRVSRRLPIVRRHLPHQLTSERHIMINGYSTFPVEVLIERLRRMPQLLEELEPASVSFPVHGDAVLSNFIWRDAPDGGAAFAAIDPRGTLEPWDALYDFSKMFFSLCIYDLGMKSGFSVDWESTAREPPRVRLRLREEREEHERACKRFFEFLTSAPAFKSSFLARETHLRKRILFGNALHCLAFSACRAANDSDPSSRGQRARVETSLGFYLAGAAFLQTLMDAELKRRELDVNEYLQRLMPDRTRASDDTATYAEPGMACGGPSHQVVAERLNVE